MRKATETRSSRRKDEQDDGFMQLIAWIASGDTTRVMDAVKATPELARMSAIIGASRESSSEYFFTQIRHYLYGGDTALHIAAADSDSRLLSS